MIKKIYVNSEMLKDRDSEERLKTFLFSLDGDFYVHTVGGTYNILPPKDLEKYQEFFGDVKDKIFEENLEKNWEDICNLAQSLPPKGTVA